MPAIYKYDLGFMAQQGVQECTVLMPVNAEILALRFYDDEITLWAKINTNVPDAMRTFYVHPTGEFELKPSAKYLQTVFDDKNVHSWHVYEI